MQDWIKQWQAMSQQFAGAMNDLAGGKPADPAAAWQKDAAAAWQKMAQPFAAAAGMNTNAAPAEILDRLGAGAKTFFVLLQSLGNAGRGGGAKAFTDALRQGFNVPGLDPSLLDNPVAQVMRDLAGQGAQGFDAMMGEFARAAAPLQQQWQGTLGMPTFGLAREHQERWQAIALAANAWQESNNRYQALILKASRDGFERFQAKLAEREEPGRQLESVRQVYDLWIDASEEAYAEIALSPEFREAYGNMVNAQMRLRSLVQGEVERSAAQLGLPTRSEVRSLEKAVHDLRRAAKKSPAAAKDDSIAPLKAEIARLRAEVAALKSAGVKTEAPKKSAAPRARAVSARASSTPPARKPAPKPTSTTARKR